MQTQKACMILSCPRCGKWFINDEDHIYWRKGDICENIGETGPCPERCSPENPCTGELVPVSSSSENVLTDKYEILLTFDEQSDDDV